MPHAVETEGTMKDAMILNQRLFTAHRVMYHLADLQAKNVDQLYEQIYAISWHEWIDVDGYFRVDSAVRHPSIQDTRFANLKVKDAIVDRMKSQYGRRPDSGNEHKGSSVFLFWNEREGSIHLDTTGEPLNKRGYRIRPFAAPMQETLAAALVLQTQWNPNAPLLNPMCGGGTIAIEAAMMATHRSPGLLRTKYAYQFLKSYDEQEETAINETLASEVQDPPNLTIIASDHDPRAIQASKMNAEKAGVAHCIQFEVVDFKDTTVPESDGDGVVLINAEYGEQLGEIQPLKKIYHDIGQWFKQRCQGYTGYLFTGTPELMKSVGLKPDEKIPFLNAKIECRLLKYTIYKKKMEISEQVE